jgi:hypothetical protein
MLEGLGTRVLEASAPELMLICGPTDLRADPKPRARRGEALRLLLRRRPQHPLSPAFFLQQPQGDEPGSFTAAGAGLAGQQVVHGTPARSLLHQIPPKPRSPQDNLSEVTHMIAANSAPPPAPPGEGEVEPWEDKTMQEEAMRRLYRCVAWTSSS